MIPVAVRGALVHESAIARTIQPTGSLSSDGVRRGAAALRHLTEDVACEDGLSSLPAGLHA